ncbi:MAG: hypothetical protein ACREHD_06090 [Pirellulales bacterium]
MQFSLRWLFGAVAFVAIGCFSLAYPSPLLGYAVNAAIFAFLTASILGAIYAERRVFWTGCAVAGWCYVLSFSFHRGHGSPGPLGGVSIEVLQRIYPIAHLGLTDTAKQQAFFVAGHALATFVCAIAGGLVAMQFRHEK